MEGAREAGLRPVWIRAALAGTRVDRPGQPESPARAAGDGVTLIGSLGELLPMLGNTAQPGRLLG